MPVRWIAGVGMLATVGCTAWQPTSHAESPPPLPFIITFWCGPPLHLFDDARAQQIVAAGFDVVGPPCEGLLNPTINRQALDVAARHGLRVWVNDPRLGNGVGDPQAAAVVRDVVADYHDRPALAGYFVADEPEAEDFAGVGAITKQLHAQDPERFAYVNLLPDYVGPERLGAPSYEDYVERFIAAAQPRLLSFDYYPFRVDEDRPSFFTNLATMRTVAERHRLPFMLIVLAMPHGGYRDPTEAELAWQVFHAVAFGARGISYFAYWTPAAVPQANVQRFRLGLIENGKTTRHYFEAQRLNRAVRAFVAQLAGFRSIAVADSTGQFGDRFPLGPIEAIDGGAITAGWFTDDDHRLATMLVNRDYRRAASVTIRLRPGASIPEQFDLETGEWRLGLSKPIDILPGHAALLRWAAPGSGEPRPLLSGPFLIENAPGASDRLGNDG